MLITKTIVSRQAAEIPTNALWTHFYRTQAQVFWDGRMWCILYLYAIWESTGSSPRCPLLYHSLVCIENHLFIVGIGQILKKELEFIYQSDRSDRTYVYS